MPTNPRYWSLSTPVTGVIPPYSATTHSTRISARARTLLSLLPTVVCLVPLLASLAVCFPAVRRTPCGACSQPRGGSDSAPSACRSQRAAGQGGLFPSPGTHEGQRDFAQEGGGPEQLRAGQTGRADNNPQVRRFPAPLNSLPPATTRPPLSFSCPAGSMAPSASPRPPSLFVLRTLQKLEHLHTQGESGSDACTEGTPLDSGMSCDAGNFSTISTFAVSECYFRRRSTLRYERQNEILLRMEPPQFCLSK